MAFRLKILALSVALAFSAQPIIADDFDEGLGVFELKTARYLLVFMIDSMIC